MNEIVFVPKDNKLPIKYEGLVGELDEIQQRLIDSTKQLESKLPEIIEFANAAQHPKVYEALAKVASSISQMNKDAANIVKQKHDIINSSKISQEAQTINNSYTENKITMTHSEALRMIRKDL